MSAQVVSSPQRILSEKSPNTTSPTKTELVKPKIHEMKASQEQTYISPSDNILSPASKKLSEIKGKRYANVKSRSLFAKTVSKEGLKSQEKLGQVGNQH